LVEWVLRRLVRCLWMQFCGSERTNSDVADTARSSDVFALASACDVVTSRKFVRSVGSAAHIDTPATKIPKIVERIVNQCR